MSIEYTCDYCGEPIWREQPYVTFSVDGEHSDDRWSSGYRGHYHCGDEPASRRNRLKQISATLRREQSSMSAAAPDCWKVVNDGVMLIHGCGPDLEAIPVAEKPKLPKVKADPSPGPSTVERPPIDYADIRRRVGSGTPIADLEFVHHGPALALRRANIYVLEDMTDMSPIDLVSINGCSAKTAGLLMEAMVERGLAMREGSIEPGELARRIKELRHAAGISRPRLARDIGIGAEATQRVNRWEQLGAVSEEDRKLLVDFFDVDPGYLGIEEDAA